MTDASAKRTFSAGGDLDGFVQTSGRLTFGDEILGVQFCQIGFAESAVNHWIVHCSHSRLGKQGSCPGAIRVVRLDSLRVRKSGRICKTDRRTPYSGNGLSQSGGKINLWQW